jgi:hypothetical protein
VTVRATSALADLSLARERKAADRTRILDLLRVSPRGATDEELQVALGLDGSTERPRRGELAKGGLVVESGATRLTRSGKHAIVWQIRL